MSSLTFDELRKANVSRCEQVFHPLDSWSPTDWGNAMAGEAGETCNILKKMRRQNFERNEVYILDLAKELADTAVYLDLLAARMRIDLGEAIRQKFNEVSEERESTVFL